MSSRRTFYGSLSFIINNPSRNESTLSFNAYFSTYNFVFSLPDFAGWL